MRRSFDKMVLCFYVIIFCGCSLGGCHRDMGSFAISTSRHAITLVKETAYFWSSSYKLSIVVANLPRCQRSHNLLDAAVGPPFVASLYLMSAHEFLLTIGKRAYEINHVSCTVKVVSADLADNFIKIGSFVPDRRRSGHLRFKAMASRP